MLIIFIGLLNFIIFLKYKKLQSKKQSKKGSLFCFLIIKNNFFVTKDLVKNNYIIVRKLKNKFGKFNLDYKILAFEEKS